MIFALQNFIHKNVAIISGYANIYYCELNGSMPEWLMGADCKSAGYAYAGSNPARPTHKQD